jgi:hypothetical protein
MNPYLVFAIGSMTGFFLTACGVTIYMRNWFHELHDATAQRIAEAERKAYARGYQDHASATTTA